MADIEHAAIYRTVRLRLSSLVADRSATELDTLCPATPQWRVRDVVAHLTGITDDIINGRLDGVTTAPWTQAQVDARTATGLTELLDEWERNSAQVEPLISMFPERTRDMLVIDAITHELDIRGALDNTEEREGDTVAYAFGRVIQEVGSQRTSAGAGALRIIVEPTSPGGDAPGPDEAVVGEGDTTARVVVSRFEMLRAALGRRSAPQIAAWDWEGDALPDTVVLAQFQPPRPTALVE